MASRYEQISGAISAIYRSIQKIERDEMVKYGYKGAFAQYLAALKSHPDGLTSVQISEICDRDKAAVSRIISEMEAKNLVYRKNEHDNQYRAKLFLTEEGINVAEYVFKRAERAVEIGGRGLTDENRRVFYETLELIATNLDAVCEGGLPE